MNNPFTDKSTGNAAPTMFPGDNQGATKPTDYNYRIERFELGSQKSEEDASKIEMLLNRSLTEDVVILERKDSVSATTGVYTMVIIYLEKKITGEEDA